MNRYQKVLKVTSHIIGQFLPRRNALPVFTPAEFYAIKVVPITGAEFHLDQYKGHLLLIVNTASQCGFTQQYSGLEALYQRYKDVGLIILGFPSNDFGEQEPLSDSEINQFCSSSFGVTFPMFKKGSVEGKTKQPLYQFLTERSPTQFRGEILWNFEKFLIDRNGHVIGRFRSWTKPLHKKLTTSIERRL